MFHLSSFPYLNQRNIPYGPRDNLLAPTYTPQKQSPLMSSASRISPSLGNTHELVRSPLLQIVTPVRQDAPNCQHLDGLKSSLWGTRSCSREEAEATEATRGMILWMNFEGDFVGPLRTSLLWSPFPFPSFEMHSSYTKAAMI
jgi:hypothetical protein